MLHRSTRQGGGWGRARLAAVAALLAGVGQAASTAAAVVDPGPPPAVTVKIIGGEALVFSADEQRCLDNDEWGQRIDVPDAPLRAVRVAGGRALVFVAHYNNLTWTTTDFAALRRTGCGGVLTSPKDADPARFADREWVISPYRLTSTTLYALVHDEYWGAAHDAKCAERAKGRAVWDSFCLYANLTGAISRDQGRRFQHLAGPTRVAAAIQYRFSTDMNRVGVRDPTNIVRHPGDGRLYFLATVDAYQAQGPAGMCVFSSPDPSQIPWRAWDGAGFGARLGDPYALAPGAAPTTCRPVINYLTTVVYDRAHRVFVGFGHDDAVGGVFYATTGDLVHWSGRRLLLATPSLAHWRPGQSAPMVYPSFLDPASVSQSFDTTDGGGYLFFSQARLVDGRVNSRMRDLMRLKVSIETP